MVPAGGISDDTLPRAHFILGWVYAFQAQYEPAVAAAERAVALDPNNANGYFALAGVFNLFAERSTEAIELLKKAIRLNPRYPFIYAFHLGWAYNLTGRYEESIAALKQALLRNPNWLSSHLHLFFSYRLQWSSQLSNDPQTLDRAFEAAQRMIALEAASPWSHVILSQAYLWKKQYEQANAAAEQVLDLNPTNGAIYALLANTLGCLGQPEEALRLAEKAQRLNPRLQTDNSLSLGHTYYLTGRTEEAVTALKKSLNGSPADLDAHLYLAAVYSEVGRDREAQAAAAEVLRINPRAVCKCVCRTFLQPFDPHPVPLPQGEGSRSGARAGEGRTKAHANEKRSNDLGCRDRTQCLAMLCAAPSGLSQLQILCRAACKERETPARYPLWELPTQPTHRQFLPLYHREDCTNSRDAPAGRLCKLTQ
jgi:tetratricopeptide (TPR) repeat protein